MTNFIAGPAYGHLHGSRAYLVGPMDRVPDNGVIWRRRITPLLQDLGVVVLDPTNKPMTTEIVGVAKEEREEKDKFRRVNDWDGLSDLMKMIRHVDLRLTDICDFIVAHLDMRAAMCGTWEEIFNANRQKKPILVVIEGGKAAVPDWLYGVLPHHYFFGSFEEMLAYLHGLNNGNIAMDKRWTLLDQTKIRITE